MRTYQFVFDNPKWSTNLLLVTVCQIIPGVGSIVVLGYFYEMIEALHKNGDRTYPDFDFNRFLAYLTRGVWPFLVILLSSVVMVAIILPFWMLMALASGAGPRGNANPVLTLVVFVVATVAFLVSMTLLFMVTGPVALRAGLTEGLGPALSPAYIRDFVGRVWREQLTVLLFLIATCWVVGMAGMLLCCVGIYPASTLMMFASYHATYQLYELYLSRGGMPITKAGLPDDFA